METKLPKSIRKFIRQEKARIRRGVLDSKKQMELIKQLQDKFLKEKPRINTDLKQINTDKNHQYKSIKSA